MANLRTNVVYILFIVSLMLIRSEFSFATDWFEVNAGLTTSDVRVVAVDPLDGRFVYAGTADGVYKSTNSGMEWSNLGLKRVASLAIDFVDPNTLYAGTDSGSGRGDRVLFKSTDGGLNWSNRRSPVAYDFALLVMDPTDPKILYIGSVGSLLSADDVFLTKTLDGGENWIEKTSGVGVGCCTLAIDRNDPNILYAPGTLYNTGQLYQYDFGLFKSTNGGTSWTHTGLTNRLTPGTNDGYRVDLVAIDPKNSNILYAATSAYGLPGGFTGLLKSIDGGNNWRPANNGPLEVGSRTRITAIVIDPDDTNVVYAATGGYAANMGQGVFRSIDGGKNWTAFNNGLGALNIRTLALAPGSPNVLYAGTPAGVFKNIDDEPILTLNENGFCVGSEWKLTVSNTPPETSVRLMGTSNNRSWEIPDWRQTRRDGVWSENGVFASGTEGTHYLRVEVGGVLSNVVSFVVSNCRP